MRGTTFLSIPLLGTLPAPYDQADQHVRSASTTGHVVVGYAGTNRTTTGWVWTNETMTMLPVPGTSNGRVYPHATNDAGVSVGQIGITNGGLITGWVRGSGMIDVLVEWQIHAEGKVLSGPVKLEGIDQILMRAANQDRDVVGSFHGNDLWEPYLFRPGTGQHIDLGSLEGYTSGSARGVSNHSPDDGSVQEVRSAWTTSMSEGRPVPVS